MGGAMAWWHLPEKPTGLSPKVSREKSTELGLG